MRGINRARKLLRQILPLYRVFHRCIILLYHRVADVTSDPQLLCVSKTHFAEHLEYLRRHYHPMSLQDLKTAISAGKIPRYGVVVTFDDGYADNLWNAKPILERYDVPATVFVTTGYVGQNREFWWDDLERLLLLPEKLPEKLELNINGELHEWNLQKAGRPDDQKAGKRESEKAGKRESGKTRKSPILGLSAKRIETTSHQLPSAWSGRWDVTMEYCPSPRHKVYKYLHPLLRPLEDEKRQQVLTELARWAGVPKACPRAEALSSAKGQRRDGRPNYRALEHDELKELGDSGLVEIGSHSVTHPMLSAQSPDVQRDELAQSKRELEKIIGRPVNSFSYPYGGAGAVSENTIRLVRDAGYKVAVANFAALVTRRSEPYWLPRYLVRDWDGEEFASRLRRWFRG